MAKILSQGPMILASSLAPALMAFPKGTFVLECGSLFINCVCTGQNVILTVSSEAFTSDTIAGLHGPPDGGERLPRLRPTQAGSRLSE
jgi:hypothetical protein